MPLLSVSVRLFEAKSAFTVPVTLMVAPAGLLPLLVESSVTLAPSPTLSFSVIVLPAVVIPALSAIGVAPVPPVKVTVPLPNPTIGPFTVTVPVVVGARIVSGSLTVRSLTVTAPVPAALPMMMLLKPSVKFVDDEELTARLPAAVTGLIVRAPLLVKELLILTVSAASVIAPEPLELAPAIVSAPVVLVSVIAPAPVSVAVKLAPSLSVINIPLVPVLALIVAAVVNMLAPDDPMLAFVIAAVLRLIVPLPTLSKVAAVCVMSPPVTLPPVLVATVSVPPEPVVISLSAAVPVPLLAALTLICTALAVAFVVVIELPAFIVKLSAPAPSLFAPIVTVPLPALIAPERLTVF